MKKIFFISAVALSLVAVGASTNNKGSNNDELISHTQADTVAKMGASVKPLKNVEESHGDHNVIINLSNLPKKVNHHKTQHHKKVNKKKVNHKKVNKKKVIHTQVVNTCANQVPSINTQATQLKVSRVQTTNTHVGQVQTTQQQANNTTVGQTKSNVAQNSQRQSYTPQQNVRSYQVIQRHRQRVQYSQNSSSAATQIAQAESGGSYTAQNGRYYGMYQLDRSYLHGDYSPANQERVFRQYCQQRYGSVNGALAFRQQHGWY